MLVLELSFPAGRYHATPWGRHVNEGAVEWPPSPWRLLRGVVATWHLKVPEIPPSTLQALVESLASELPEFYLPPATTSHTRHYMPIQGSKTTKVFDAFVQTKPNDTLYVVWNLKLPTAQSEALSTLALRLGYLGRAESLVSVQLLQTLPQTSAQLERVRPLANDSPSDNEELVQILCPSSAMDYARWREGFLSQSEASSASSSKKTKKSKGPSVPETLFDALHADTAILQKEGWNLPPGAAYQNYARPEHLLTTPAAQRRRRKPKTLPTVARYEVVSNVLHRLTKTISVAHRVHEALCSLSDFGSGSLSVFSGRDADGKPLRGHQHAHIFCEPSRKRDAIQYVTIYAPKGFDENAQKALRSFSETWGKGGHDLRFVLHGIGQPEGFRSTPLFRPSRHFRALTPFFSTRHVKTYSDGRPKLDSEGWPIGGAHHDLQRLLELRQIGQQPLPAYSIGKPCHHITLPNGRTLRNLQFQTTRNSSQSAPNPAESGAFTLSFEKEITEPLALGYGAHFGLGLFVPIEA